MISLALKGDIEEKGQGVNPGFVGGDSAHPLLSTSSCRFAD